ncbi:MAG: hypothetical protein ACI86C_000283 [Candidatus Latescibacterota bacterium]|jgi:hypothetical protein
MKQLILLLFISNLSFAQSIVIKDSDKVIKTIVSKGDDKAYIFYPNKVSTINLNTLQSKDTVFDDKGIDIKDFGFVNSLSENYFLDPLGGGTFLFKNYSLSKIDNSYKHRMQIESSVFIYKENIYKYGGYGFWSDRNIITRFDFKTNEWELVPFLNSKTIPKGRHKSITKVIGDQLYVIGGLSINEFNPLVIEKNNEIWQFDLVNGVWTKLGEITGLLDKLINYTIIDFDDKLIIDNVTEDTLYEIDIVNNTVRSFNKTSFARKVNNSSLPIFFYKDKFYGFFKEDNSLNQITLVKRNSDEIFGKPILEEKFYNNSLKYINQILYALLLLLLVPLGVLINKSRRNKNKLIIKKDGYLYFNNKKIVLEPLSLVVLKHFINSKEPVYSKDIISLINKPHLDYSHKTRIMNDLLYKINYVIKVSLKIDDDPIKVNKSAFDKRLKEYSINNQLFVKS